MNVAELKSGQGSVEVEVVVKSKEEPRTFNKFGKDLTVCNAMVSDDSGEIKLTLWNDDVDKVNEGDRVKVSNGYVSEFNGERQLTSGKFGKIEVVSGSNAGEDSAPEKKAKAPAKKEVEVSEDEMPM